MPYKNTGSIREKKLIFGHPSMKWSIFNLGFHLAVWTLEAFGDCSRAYIQHVVQNFYYALTFNFFIQVIIKLKQDGPSEDSTQPVT